MPQNNVTFLPSNLKSLRVLFQDSAPGEMMCRQRMWNWCVDATSALTNLVAAVSFRQNLATDLLKKEGGPASSYKTAA